MIARIAWFELRYQMRSPAFWVVFGLFFLFSYGALALDAITIGSGANVHVNSPYAIALIHLVLAIFYMFATTALVGGIIVRDDQTGFAPLVGASHVTPTSYLFGRALGGFGAAALAFISVPLGAWLGAAMPWLDASTVGTEAPLTLYLSSYLVFALPTLFLTSSIFFAVATITRSMPATYVSVIALLVAYTLFQSFASSHPDLRELTGYLEPFGIAAFFEVTRYWTAAERNAAAPALSGLILGNRLIWAAVSLAFLALARARFSFRTGASRPRRWRRRARRRVEVRSAAHAPRAVSPLPRPDFTSAKGAQLKAAVRLETLQILKSPAFFILVGLGALLAFLTLHSSTQIYGTPSLPRTFLVVGLLENAFGLILLILAVFYAGEAVWRDRTVEMHEIIDATPLPSWAHIAAKLIAVILALALTLLCAMLAAILFQLARGHTELELGRYVTWYLLPGLVDAAILAALAIFVQVLSPSKYVGWAMMVLYIVATMVASQLELDHPLALYGSTAGPVTLSDLNGDRVGGPLAWWLRGYWAAAAVILASLSYLLWPRGAETRFRPRLRRLRARIKTRAGWVLIAASLAMVGFGALLATRIHVQGAYRTEGDLDALSAAKERAYLPYEDLAQPVLEHIVMRLDLYPEEGRLKSSGSYRLVNTTSQPIETLHLQLPTTRTEVVSVEVPGATLSSDDAALGYRIYSLAPPLPPGGRMTLSYALTRSSLGLSPHEPDTRLVENGTFLSHWEFAPRVGMDRLGLLEDRKKRREQGLPGELRLTALEDPKGAERNLLYDADWVTSEITVTTVADQTPLAPGAQVSDEVIGGRREAVFVSKRPILNFFSVQSARYAVRRREADGIELEVYFHPTHGDNITRMLDAMEASLTYYREAFGPYPFEQLRIVEFPGYELYAQAFAGTVPFSERLGFIADHADADAIDYVTYITAHEVAHQYWAHQLIGASQQGGVILAETLAQYSALMVMRRLHGPDHLRRFLKYELDQYLGSRGGDPIGELPLVRAEAQPYIYYRKGSLVTYLLQEKLGEARVNAMLAELLGRYRFADAPFASASELLDGYLALARDEEERALVRDLLERITIYDFATTQATTRATPEGQFETELTVTVRKAYADELGEEDESPFDGHVDVGLFLERPEFEAFSVEHVIALERRRLVSGENTLRFVTDKAPTFAGVDPYTTWIDRDDDDNLIAVHEGEL